MTTKNSAETPLSSSHHKSAARRPSLASKLALTLLTLIVIASIAYALYTNQQQLANQIKNLSTEVVTVKQQQTDTKALFDSNFDKLGSTQTKLNDRLDGVSKNLSQALQEHLYQNNDWLLLKARYYLELAEINAHWSDNTQTTSALLQQADDLLANLHEPELYIVRQAIAKEMTQLQAIPTIDIVGLLAKLDAAQQLLTDLPIKNPFTLTEASPSVTASNKIPSAWRERVQNSIQLLKKLVLIRHHDETIEPLLAPEYESLLRETCFLNLQEAQWAVIQRNPDVYKLSLTQAINTIKRTFSLQAKNTQTLLQQLNDLQQTQLDLQKPTMGESLLLLNQVIASKKSNPPVPAPEPKNEKENSEGAKS